MKSVFLLSFVVLFFASSAYAFSITDYYSQVDVKEDGSINVYEKMTFQLDQEYNEGFRSIRKEDFGSLSDISVARVKVNGNDVEYYTQMNGDQAEIVWKKTFVGQNIVELNYSITDRVQLYNDYAKLCFEHYGANWPAAAEHFMAKTTLPSASGGKAMHFQIFSSKEGDAHIENLSIITEVSNVPGGNYVGACYLFARDSVRTSNTVNASAYDILKQEREIYGSRVILEEEEPIAHWCCIPVFLLSALVAAAMFLREKKRPKNPESILPPGKDEPVVVTALVRNKYEKKELVAATIVDLINRGVIDIVELEKEGANAGEGMNRERTILMLKKRLPGLKDHERAVLDLIFAQEKQVDLDALMIGYNKVKSESEAKKLPIVKRITEFNIDFDNHITSVLEKDAEQDDLSGSSDTKGGTVASIAMVALFFAAFFSCSFLTYDIEWYLSHGESSLLYAVLAGGVCSLGFGAYTLLLYLKPDIPKTPANHQLYAKWDAFYRGLKSSRIKEYPPSSAMIWGDILKYATALGLADKVNRHLSELDPVLARRVAAMDTVAISTMTYYTSAVAVHNLGTYGNRAGASSNSGGFSSGSSGGWSSGGGGGFSGGSSGGGGFR